MVMVKALNNSDRKNLALLSFPIIIEFGDQAKTSNFNLHVIIEKEMVRL